MNTFERCRQNIHRGLGRDELPLTVEVARAWLKELREDIRHRLTNQERGFSEMTPEQRKKAYCDDARANMHDAVISMYLTLWLQKQE